MAVAKVVILLAGVYGVYHLEHFQVANSII